MLKACAAIRMFILLLPIWVFGQTDNPPDTCWQAEAVQLSAAQTKSLLRYTTPVNSPLLWNSMRMTNAILVFKIRTDEDGNIACLRVVSGHPIIIAGAIESVKNWKFRPKKVDGQGRSIYGTLVLRISCCKQGIESKVLNEVPPQRTQ